MKKRKRRNKMFESYEPPRMSKAKEFEEMDDCMFRGKDMRLICKNCHRPFGDHYGIGCVYVAVSE